MTANEHRDNHDKRVYQFINDAWGAFDIIVIGLCFLITVLWIALP